MPLLPGYRTGRAMSFLVATTSTTSTTSTPRSNVTSAAFCPADTEAPGPRRSAYLIQQRPLLREIVVEESRHPLIRPFEAFRYCERNATPHDPAAHRRALKEAAGQAVTAKSNATAHHQMRAQSGRKQALCQQHGDAERRRVLGDEAVTHPDAEQECRQIHHAAARTDRHACGKSAAQGQPQNRRPGRNQCSGKHSGIQHDAHKVFAGRRAEIARESSGHRREPRCDAKHCGELRPAGK